MQMSSEFYTELYNVKKSNVEKSPKTGGYCKECRFWDGHNIDCSKVTLEDAVKLAIRNKKQEIFARERAANYLEQLQRLTGKLAILRHENNKLRKQNERLRKNDNGN